MSAPPFSSRIIWPVRLARRRGADAREETSPTLDAHEACFDHNTTLALASSLSGHYRALCVPAPDPVARKA